MSDHKVCTGACLFGKCPFDTCIKYKQGVSHKPIKADMSILTSGNLPHMPTAFKGFGVAVDIGTTTIAAYLYNLEQGECVDVESTINPQASFGVDVISRIKYCADRQGGLKELQAAVVEGLNRLIKTLCGKQSISTDDITRLSITGNTTMLHLLTDTDPTPMGVFPFSVPDYFGRYMDAKAIGLECGCPVYLERCIAAFVGGDITSAMLSTNLKQNSVSLLLDIGTNGEVALAVGDKIYVSSTAAGPAFEGAELSSGMAAVKGAVSHVYALQGEIQTTVIGDAAPQGLCGSGVLDAVALMRTSGIMDETGRIQDSAFTVTVKDEPAFRITEGIHITQRDIRRIQTAKSAIAAGVLALVHRASLTVDDISQVFLAGGFGSYMDADSAVAIGLILPAFRQKLKNVGNSAGAGAGMTLLSEEYIRECASIAEACTHVELSTDPYFMDQYVECMMF